MSLQLIPEGQMNQMGEQAYAEMRSKTPLSKNPALREVIERVGKRIAEASGKQYAWEFELFDDPKTVNAFCLPGGKIAFYTGILPIAENEAGLELGLQFGVLLPYSRAHETEADVIGLRYMAKAGYQPREAVTLWERMNKANGGRVPEFMSTHPDPANRAAKLNAAIPDILPLYNAAIKQPSKPLPLN